MLRNYFSLRFTLARRWLKDSGINPILAFLMALIIFLLFSFRLFQETRFAEYFYVSAALLLAYSFSEKKRNDFLETCFNRSQYHKIRIIENMAATLPFVIFLLYKQSFIAAIILLIAALLLSLLKFGTSYNITVPTPFFKYPFEFLVGFRKSFYLIFLMYTIAVIAVSAGNYNLGAFALIILFLLAAGYYSNLENEYYVWQYNLNAKEFIIKKMKVAFRYTFLLVIPVIVLLSVFFYNHYGYTLIIFLYGYLFLSGVILSKYSSYPDPLTVVNGILIVAGAIFPPLLLILIIYFFNRSEKRLKPLLG